MSVARCVIALALVAAGCSRSPVTMMHDMAPTPDMAPIGDGICADGWIRRPASAAQLVDTHDVVHDFGNYVASDGSAIIQHWADGQAPTAIATNLQLADAVAASDGSLHVLAYHTVPLYQPDQAYELTSTDWRSGSWQQRTIDGCIFPLHIAVDAKGASHVTCRDTGSPQITASYFTNASGAWTSTPIGVTYTNDVLISTDGNGHAHVLFAAEQKYASNASGAWITDNLFGIIAANQPQHLFVDGNGVPHVLATAQHASKTSDGWHSQPMPGPDWTKNDYWFVGAVGRSGIVHVAFDGASQIFYATNASGAFVTTTIGFPGETVGSTNLLVDGEDRPMLFVTSKSRGLRLLRPCP